MVPLLEPNNATGRAGAGRVSLEALTELVVLIALLFAGGAALVLLIALADAGWKLVGLAEVRDLPMQWMEVGLVLGSMALPLAWIARRWRSLHIAPSMPLGAGLASGVIAGAAGVGISYPIYWLGQWAGNDMLPSNAAYVEQLLEGQWMLALFALVVMTPVTEEIVFRKFLLARFLKSGFPLLGIALTSVLFALMHEPFPREGQGVVGWALLLVDYSLAGALLAAAYCLTGRLSAAILAHATHNLIVCVVYWASL